jgi:hypothetical protein
VRYHKRRSESTAGPFFGYYFAPVWGTIAPIARPGKPQFSSGRIFTESSNPSPSSAESRANLAFVDLFKQHVELDVMQMYPAVSGRRMVCQVICQSMGTVSVAWKS